MQAAARTAVNNLDSVDESVLNYFRESAASLIEAEGEDTEALVARCLALAAGKTSLKTWSLQTGESGWTTVTIKAPRPLK